MKQPLFRILLCRMRRHPFRLCLGFLLCLTAACGSEREAEVSPRDSTFTLLREFHQALEDEDYDAAAALYLAPTGTEDDIAKAIPEWIERREISENGIRALEDEGNFGRLLEVFPRKGTFWAKSVGLNPDVMWGVRLGSAEVAVASTSGGWRIVRLDEVGKIGRP